MALKLSSNRTSSFRDLPGDKGLAGLGRQSDRAFSFRNLPGGTFAGNALRALLTTALSGSNNDLTFSAVDRGTSGNSITVAYVVSGNSTPLTVAVSGSAITVNVATSGGGAATSTAAQIKAAVEAAVDAGRLVSVTYPSGNDGTGVVTALAATNLAGGTNLVTYGRMVLATLTTALTGSNNDLKLTAKSPNYQGAAGNAISLTIVDPPGNNAALSVSVSGTDITVNGATDGSSALTSTAALVKAAIEASAAAAALVTVTYPAGNDGSGVVTALAKTNLSGGVDWVAGP